MHLRAFHSYCPERREAACIWVSIPLVWTGVGQGSSRCLVGGASIRVSDGGGEVSFGFSTAWSQLSLDPREHSRLGV